MQVWDVDARSLLLSVHGGGPQVLFSPDASYIAVASGNYITKLDPNEGTMIGTPFGTQDSNITSMSFSMPDSAGRYELALCYHDRSIRFWDPRTGLQCGPSLYGHSNSVNDVAYSPDGGFVVSGSNDRTVRVWSRHHAEQGVRSLEQHDNSVSAVTYSPDGRHIVSGSDDCTIRIWNADDGKLVKKLSGADQEVVQSIAYTSDGGRLATSSGKAIQLWDMKTMKPVGSPLLGHTDYVRSITFSPNGTSLVSGSDDRRIGVWELNMLSPSGRFLAAHAKAVESVAFSPKGTTFVSASWDETIVVWDAQSTVPIGRPIQGNDGTMWSVAYSPDGTKLAAGSFCQVTLWDINTRAIVGHPMIGHTAPVVSLSFSLCGEYVATGSYDETVRIWEWKKNTTLGKPLQPGFQIRDIAFSPKSNDLALVGASNEVRVWNASIHQNSNTSLQNVTLYNERQYPPSIFPDQTWNIEDGWLRNSNKELLLWVPHEYRLGLRSPQVQELNNLPMVELDFERFKCGVEWTECIKISLDHLGMDSGGVSQEDEKLK